ncbi:alpha/beta-hydrolase [Infundibulicybe gibba]|nr:alpha/beta-hydrolase [Infundibulicybe gibba]
MQNPGSESYTIKSGIKVTERFFTLPLDYANPNGRKITVFARHLVPQDKAKTPEAEEKLPYRGPGFEIGLPNTSGFAEQIHEKGYQTLWLDQRGTGLSTPISPECFPEGVSSGQEIADYLKHFRADNIVKDCEAIREILLGGRTDPEERKWTLMGQSFGGFCAITYLSFHSEGIKEVFLTGGLAPLGQRRYHALIGQVVKRNRRYYEKYPRDIKRVHDILTYLEAHDVRLPNGGKLTPSRFQQLGMAFGMHGGIDRIHLLVFRASNELNMFHKIGYKTLQNLQQEQPFDGNPIYAILHEPLYCQGQAPQWSAKRLVDAHPKFSWAHVRGLGNTEPVLFTGEMIFPDMFDNYANLRPLKGAAEILAADDSWGKLYDLEQLAKNEVKVSAITYVDFTLAQDTALKIKNVEQYITNNLVHDGLGEDGKLVMGKLFQMSRREYD